MILLRILLLVKRLYCFRVPIVKYSQSAVGKKRRRKEGVIEKRRFYFVDTSPEKVSHAIKRMMAAEGFSPVCFGGMNKHKSFERVPFWTYLQWRKEYKK